MKDGLFTKVDKHFILKYVSEEEIFEKYMMCRVYPGTLYHSVLRADKRPTCSFIYTKGRLRLKDFNGSFFDDCFAFVQVKYGIGHHEAVELIASDFNLINRKNKRKPRVFNEDFKQNSSDIKVVWKDYTESELEYWNDFGIHNATLTFYNVGSVNTVWLENKLLCVSTPSNRIFGYWFSESEIKAYFIDKSEYRFLGNYRGLQGISQLPLKGELLIITKSLKDVMYYRQMGIYAVAPSSESSILTPTEYDDLSSRFTKIVVNYDFDRTGVRSTHKMKKLYNLPYFFIRSDRHDDGPKDVTDHHKAYGYQRTKELVHKRLRDACKI